ncbi:hypothetical protein CYLTODRAFT_453779 [Cylindrobasidium torrendii FP15055 ss-10]|uniref:DUF6533 domain-containing protein n=1 Tax=Cylindrobasidium torrendii FP15055 ss-10 TaxID=1314674 RepID=A0A0D7BEW2_9AGAR|nr:hypothetical protein CYLTODRAFT_453779 [Cylindrobasidium torrendii FP15055 ss-10]
MFDIISGSVVASGTLLVCVIRSPENPFDVEEMQVYDWICTLDQEIEAFWFERTSLASVLFFLNRYLPFVDTFLNVYLLINSAATVQARVFLYPEMRADGESLRLCVCYCRISEKDSGFPALIVVGLLISEVILMIRTYAVWGRRRWILITFSIQLSVLIVISTTVTQLEMDSLVYSPLSGTGPYGCVATHGSPVIMFSYGALLLSETIIAILTAIKARQHLRRSPSSWVYELYVRYGLSYYVYTFVFALANTLVPVLKPSLANWLATPQRVLHSICCTRILLLIHRQKVESREHAILSTVVLDRTEATSPMLDPEIKSTREADLLSRAC